MAETVTDREQRQVAEAVIVGDHVVACFIRSRPGVDVPAAHGIPVPRLGPPGSGRGRDRNEREWLLRGHGAAMRDVELHGWRVLYDRQRKAPGIESQGLGQPGGAPAELVPGAGAGSKRVPE